MTQNTRLKQYIDREVEKKVSDINERYQKMVGLFDKCTLVKETHYECFSELVFEAPLGWYACRDYPVGSLFDLALKEIEEEFRAKYDILKIKIKRSTKDSGFSSLVCKCTVPPDPKRPVRPTRSSVRNPKPEESKKRILSSPSGEAGMVDFCDGQ